MVKVAKSGWPVSGQTHVNSGQTHSTSYSRSGCGFGKATRSFDGCDGTRGSLPTVHRRPSGEADLAGTWDATIADRVFRYRFLRLSAIALCTYGILGLVITLVMLVVGVVT